MSNRILIAGYTGFGNAGDEAIAHVITTHLRERIPGAQITILSGDPPRTAETYGVRALWWRDPIALAEAVRHSDLVILGGGGLFQDYWGFDPAAILTREHWGLSFYLAPALLAAIYARPLMLYAVGAGPLLSEHGRTYTKVAGDIASRITVRDHASRDLFVSLGVAPEKITVTADPVFDFAPPAALPNLPPVGPWKSAGPSVAVCLRTWNFGSDSTFSDREVAAALDDFLLDEGGRILFVPFGGGDDIYVARRVFNQMRFRERAAVLEQPLTPADTAAILAHADLVLGMRLHSVIFSLLAHVPFVALEYDPKVAGLAALTGFEEFTLPFGGIEAYVIAGRLRWALGQKERFRSVPIDDLRRQARQNADIAADLLRHGTTVTDYGPDTRTLIGRLIMAQVAGSENLIGRIERACAVVGVPHEGVRPLPMADTLIDKIKEVQSRLEEVDALQAQLTESRQAAARLDRELRDAGHRLEETARQSQAALERQTAQLALDLAIAHNIRQETAAQLAACQYQLARYESKTFAGVSKRALEVVLDFFQLITPGPLRAAVRKYYLNWFYFRIYPERRAGTLQSRDN